MARPRFQYHADDLAQSQVERCLSVIGAPVIAIVDDDVSICRALHRLLESGGYAVQTFASAHEFLDSLRRNRPACLLLDIHLDGMSGFDLQERLVADGVGVPVLFITAHDDMPTRKRIERSGAAGHLRKPVDGPALLDAIRLAIGLAEGPNGRPVAVD